MFRNVLFAALVGVLTYTWSASLQADLVGYWPMDGDVNDGTSNGLDGELFGDTAFVDDVPDALDGGMSLLLNTEFTLDGGVSEADIDAEGNPGYVDLGNPDILNFSDNDFTIASWMKVPELLFQRGNIFSNGGDNGGGVRYVLAYLENGGQSVVLTTDDNTDKRQAEANAFDWVVDDEDWHHVVGVKTESELLVYVDGELAGENLDVPVGYDLSGTSQRPAYIGLGADSASGAFEKYFQGWLDDVAVWNEALDEDQIATVMSGDFSQWLDAVMPGDYNGDGVLDALDMDLQAAEMKKPQAEQDLAKFDHNGDGVVDLGLAGPDQSKWGDRLIWIRTLRGSAVGDADMDGVFDSGDLVLALTGAKYGSGEMATWTQGDWNGDMLFDSGDLVLAFQDGQYVAAATPAAVPEPSSAGLVMMSLFAIAWYRRRIA